MARHGDPLERCLKCGRDVVDYWRPHCRCGEFLGFPNYRQAVSERDILMERYDSACSDAKRRGVEALLIKLETLADRSLPVIAMSFAACDDILRSDKYRNYERRVDSGERAPADAQDHADRVTIGVRLYPMYNQHIHYAALSPDGRGLANYGEVAVRWRVTAVYLQRRASLIEENSYTFYDDHALGGRGAIIPPGYRAIWEDRAKLAIAKLVPRLTAATAESTLPSLIMHAGPTRNEDDFIEVAIYADGDFDTQDVDMVTVLRAATTPETTYRQEVVRGTCANRGIALIE